MKPPHRSLPRSHVASLALLALLALTPRAADASEPPPLVHARQLSVGSGCSGSEGMWNCMTSSWQRCASGLWSQTMQCAAGTECHPPGQNYEFHVTFAQSDAPGYTSAGTRVGGWGRGWVVWAVAVGGGVGWVVL